MTTPRPSDTELVHRAKAGDLEAFDQLVRRHEQSIYSLARRITGNAHDAEDVTQQTFLSALENLGGFREESSFRTWLTRIAAHAALHLLRHRRRHAAESLDTATDPPPPGEGALPHPEFIADWRESPEQLLSRRETIQLIEEALAKLDEKYRVVFVLRDIEGLSVRETAELTGLSEANVKVRLLRARLALRETLTRAFGDPSTRQEPHPHA